VPAGAKHNVINTGAEALKMYTIYGPPNHLDGTIRATKEAAERQDEKFYGKTSE
jgi:mannose-6-phosphate isomerase-like protein (cupin superfamily)